MFAFMGSLDTKGASYKYEVALAGPALELHNCMAKLLAHPLQRPCQTHASYSLLEEDEEAGEEEEDAGVTNRGPSRGEDRALEVQGEPGGCLEKRGMLELPSQPPQAERPWRFLLPTAH